MRPLFSIIIVCLNPGEKLKETLCSVQEQICHNYEVIIKDGLSTDGSLQYVDQFHIAFQPGMVPELRLVSRKDSGIYDAMNQAVEIASGQYLYFLNCGDLFYHNKVLADIQNNIEFVQADLYYGNIFERKTGQMVSSNPKLDAFGCYRNVPCHQACFYQKKLLVEHPFCQEYRVRADYEQFLWCFFIAKAKIYYCEVVIADYEGGGFSESKENSRRSCREHKEITEKYMSKKQLYQFKMTMWLTLAPLRTLLAENKATAAFYNRIKKIVYKTTKNKEKTSD